MYIFHGFIFKFSIAFNTVKHIKIELVTLIGACTFQVNLSSSLISTWAKIYNANQAKGRRKEALTSLQDKTFNRKYPQTF